jgi:hypothetical protein
MGDALLGRDHMIRSFAAAVLVLSVGACLNPVNVGSMGSTGTAGSTGGGTTGGSVCGGSCVPVSPSPIDFGQVPIGQVQSLGVTVTNCSPRRSFSASLLDRRPVSFRNP